MVVYCFIPGYMNATCHMPHARAAASCTALHIWRCHIMQGHGGGGKGGKVSHHALGLMLAACCCLGQGERPAAPPASIDLCPWMHAHGCMHAPWEHLCMRRSALCCMAQVEKAPLESYADVGGLEQQIQAGACSTRPTHAHNHTQPKPCCTLRATCWLCMPAAVWCVLRSEACRARPGPSRRAELSVQTLHRPAGPHGWMCQHNNTLRACMHACRACVCTAGDQRGGGAAADAP